MGQPSSPSITIDALHPDWRGTIRLFPEENRLVLVEHGTWGNYKINDTQLDVFWDEFNAETFFKISNGFFIQKSILPMFNYPSIQQADHLIVYNRVFPVKRVNLTVAPETDVGVRLNTSDVPTFAAIFDFEEYSLDGLVDQPKTIVDLGANVGYASVYFALKYPDAQILAVEPDLENFQELTANVAKFSDRISLVQGAAWVYDGKINLKTDDDEGHSLGAWGVQVSETPTGSKSMVNCYTINSLMDRAAIASVDILKIDVEGAEREIFAQGADKWLSRANLVLVETHDRFRPGSEASVRSALSADFEELPQRGENLYFRRKVQIAAKQ